MALAGWSKTKRFQFTIDKELVEDSVEYLPLFFNLSTSTGINSDNITFVFDSLAILGNSYPNRKKIAITQLVGSEEILLSIEIVKWDNDAREALLWFTPSILYNNKPNIFYFYYDSNHEDNPYVYGTGEVVSAPVNLMLNIGFEGTYDINHVWPSTILKVDGTYKLWYNGENGNRWSTLYCESTDFINWSNQQVVLDGTDGYDSSHSHTGTVLYEDGIYKLWSAMNSGDYYKIIYCDSIDGLTWDNFTLVVDKNNITEDSTEVFSPAVINDDGTYHMWYTGSSGDDWAYIIYCDSPDGITWYNHQVVMSRNTHDNYSSSQIRSGTVKYIDNKYVMWYNAYNNTEWRIMYTESSDGITWSDGVVFFNNTTESFATSGSIYLTLLEEDDQYKFLYGAYSSYSGTDAWRLVGMDAPDLNGYPNPSKDVWIDKFYSTYHMITDSTDFTRFLSSSEAHDDFDDEDITDSLWISSFYGAGSYSYSESDGKIKLSIDSAADGGGSHVYDAVISGDFNIEIDFSDYIYLYGANAILVGLSFAIDGGDYMRMTTYNYPGYNGFMGRINSSWTGAGGATSGKFRVRRVGSTGYVDLDKGSGWVNIRSSTVSTNPGKASLWIYNETTAYGSIKFNNFNVVSADSIILNGTAKVIDSTSNYRNSVDAGDLAIANYHDVGHHALNFNYKSYINFGNLDLFDGSSDIGILILGKFSGGQEVFSKGISDGVRLYYSDAESTLTCSTVNSSLEEKTIILSEDIVDNNYKLLYFRRHDSAGPNTTLKVVGASGNSINTIDVNVNTSSFIIGGSYASIEGDIYEVWLLTKPFNDNELDLIDKSINDSLIKISNYFVHGYATIFDEPVSRPILIYSRDTGDLLGHDISFVSNGYYYLELSSDEECFIVGLDGDMYNHFIIGRVIPRLR